MTSLTGCRHDIGAGRMTGKAAMVYKGGWHAAARLLPPINP